LQQLEEAKLIEKGQKGAHKGKILTKEGFNLIEKAAEQVQKTAPKPEAKQADNQDKKKAHEPKEVKKAKQENGPSGDQAKKAAGAAKPAE